MLRVACAQLGCGSWTVTSINLELGRSLPVLLQQCPDIIIMTILQIPMMEALGELASKEIQSAFSSIPKVAVEHHAQDPTISGTHRYQHYEQFSNKYSGIPRQRVTGGYGRLQHLRDHSRGHSGGLRRTRHGDIPYEYVDLADEVLT